MWRVIFRRNFFFISLLKERRIIKLFKAFSLSRTTDNFILTSSRSNPGSAYVSCAVDVVQGDQTLSPNDVRVSFGKNVSSTTSFPYSSTNVNGGLRNNSFVIDSIEDDDKIFCHVGELARTERSFSRVDFSPINFYGKKWIYIHRCDRPTSP